MALTRSFNVDQSANEKITDFKDDPGKIGDSDPTWDGGSVAVLGFDAPAAANHAVVAHELGHLFDVHHTNSAGCAPQFIDDDAKWPYKQAHSLIMPDVGIDIGSAETKLLLPENVFDFMSHCGGVDYGSKWVSAWTYDKLVSHYYSQSMVTAGVSEPQPRYLVSGVVFTDTTALMEPLWKLETAAPMMTDTVGEYCIDSLDAAGALLYTTCFDVDFFNYEEGVETSAAGFTTLIPYSESLNKVQLRRGEKVLEERQLSETAPNVEVIYPNGNEVWEDGETYTIEWSGEDDDGDGLVYQVSYSIDGDAWIPLAMDITDTTLEIDAGLIPGSENAVIRVAATDGIRTAEGVSDRSFVVKKKSPVLEIRSVSDGQVVAPDTSLLLTTLSYDVEDKIIDDESIVWQSNIDGELGVGHALWVSLSAGEHLLSVTATDSDGNKTKETISLFSGYRTYLPLIAR